MIASLAFRGLTSDRHYDLDEQQFIRSLLHNNVTNTQRFWELSAQYAFDRRFSLVASLPYVNSSFSLADRPRFFLGDSSTPGPTAVVFNGKGIGDLSMVGRWWVGDPKTHERENVQVGLGIKFPTGDFRQQSFTTDIAGRNPQLRFSDISVQPGDGGTGIIFEASGYKRIRKSTFTLNGTYLANPRNTNGTPSIITSLGIPPSAATANLLVNSTPDSYLARFGWYYPTGLKGLIASVAYRWEGLPRFDLLGNQDGFRRPGYETFVEPGITYNNGPHQLNISVPIAHLRFRGLNSSVNPVTGRFDRGDATFPDAIFLGSYSYRFNTRRSRKKATRTANGASRATKDSTPAPQTPVGVGRY